MEFERVLDAGSLSRSLVVSRPTAAAVAFTLEVNFLAAAPPQPLTSDPLPLTPATLHPSFPFNPTLPPLFFSFSFFFPLLRL